MRSYPIPKITDRRRTWLALYNEQRADRTHPQWNRHGCSQAHLEKTGANIMAVPLDTEDTVCSYWNKSLTAYILTLHKSKFKVPRFAEPNVFVMYITQQLTRSPSCSFVECLKLFTGVFRQPRNISSSWHTGLLHAYRLSPWIPTFPFSSTVTPRDTCSTVEKEPLAHCCSAEKDFASLQHCLPLG